MIENCYVRKIYKLNNNNLDILKWGGILGSYCFNFIIRFCFIGYRDTKSRLIGKEYDDKYLNSNNIYSSFQHNIGLDNINYERLSQEEYRSSGNIINEINESEILLKILVNSEYYNFRSMYFKNYTEDQINLYRQKFGDNNEIFVPYLNFYLVNKNLLKIGDKRENNIYLIIILLLIYFYLLYRLINILYKIVKLKGIYNKFKSLIKISIYLLLLRITPVIILNKGGSKFTLNNIILGIVLILSFINVLNNLITISSNTRIGKKINTITYLKMLLYLIYLIFGSEYLIRRI